MPFRPRRRSKTRLFKPFRNLAADARHQATLARLRQLATTIESREMLARLCAQHPDPAKMRALITPMLPADLPCCQVAWLGRHSEACPAELLREDVGQEVMTNGPQEEGRTEVLAERGE